MAKRSILGFLDRRVTIQVNAPTLDGAGQEVEVWSTVATVWMRVKPQRGGERFQAHQVMGKAVTTFQARHRTDVSVLNRLVYDGKDWDIHDVREMGRKRGIEIDATARSEG